VVGYGVLKFALEDLRNSAYDGICRNLIWFTSYWENHPWDESKG